MPPMTMTNNNTEHFTDKELFKIAKETRDFEIEMFWRRTNYFLLLNVSVGTGFAYFYKSLPQQTHFLGELLPLIILSIIGLCVCFAWIKVGLGAKYWQSHWEQVLVDLQPKLGMEGEEGKEQDTAYFSNKGHKERVRRNLEITSCYDCCVLQKPSVSRWMHRTACLFLAAWVIVIGATIVKIICNSYW